MSQLRDLTAELWRGLTEPSPPAIGGAVLVALGLLGFCVRAITPAWLASGIFVTFPGDDEASVTGAALSLQHAPLNRVELALIGSSASREALENVHGVELRVAPQLGLEGRDVSFHALTAGALTHMNAVALVDYLPKGFRGLVVLEISERNLALPRAEALYPVEGPRLPLDSTLLDEARQRLGATPDRKTGWLFLDHYAFFLARPSAFLNAWRGGAEPSFHQIDRFPDPTPAEWVEIDREWSAWTQSYAELSEANLEIYRWLIAHLHARPGVGVVLLQAPRNPDVIARVYAEGEPAAVYARFRADVEALARDSGAALWRIHEDLKIPGSSYKDQAHIVAPEGRRVFTEEFARRAAAWCQAKACIGPEPPGRSRRGPATGSAARADAPRLPAPVHP